jgi:hypothetical protein
MLCVEIGGGFMKAWRMVNSHDPRYSTLPAIAAFGT